MLIKEFKKYLGNNLSVCLMPGTKRLRMEAEVLKDIDVYDNMSIAECGLNFTQTHGKTVLAITLGGENKTEFAKKGNDTTSYDSVSKELEKLGVSDEKDIDRVLFNYNHGDFDIQGDIAKSGFARIEIYGKNMKREYIGSHYKNWFEEREAADKLDIYRTIAYVIECLQIKYHWK